MTNTRIKTILVSFIFPFLSAGKFVWIPAKPLDIRYHTTPLLSKRSFLDSDSGKRDEFDRLPEPMRKKVSGVDRYSALDG
jgi:hypothetical protein